MNQISRDVSVQWMKNMFMLWSKDEPNNETGIEKSIQQEYNENMQLYKFFTKIYVDEHEYTYDEKTMALTIVNDFIFHIQL